MAHPSTPPNRLQIYSTIIIGAGISGLGAASRLLELSKPHSQSSTPDILVLEARPHIGGRIGEELVNGNRLDTGANWIHGVGTEDEPNPLLGVLEQLRKKGVQARARGLGDGVRFRIPSPAFSQEDDEVGEETDVEGWVKVDSRTDSPHTDLVIPAKVSKQMFGILWGMMGSLHERAERTSAEGGKGTSLLQAIREDGLYRDAYEMAPREYRETLAGMPQFVENMEAGPLEGSSAIREESEEEGGIVGERGGLSLLEYAIEDFDGDQVFLQDGYMAVAQEVGGEVLEKSLVRLGVEVEQINWGGETIEVITKEGETFRAKRVICTLPLGVLQHNISRKMLSQEGQSFFNPPLPQAKVEAIQSLGFGTLDKIFMVYSSPWWTTEPFRGILQKGVTDGDDDDDDDEQQERLVTSAKETDGLWGFTTELSGLSIPPSSAKSAVQSGPRSLSLINLHSLTGFPVLSAFVSCANAVHIESLSNDAAAAIVHRALSSWLGREVPAPDAVHVTRWHQDPYSRGSYSHMVTGLSETKHREEFQTPLRNGHGAELRFAGEHTSRNHFATVHGALMSGYREAEAVLRSEAAESRCRSYGVN